MHAVSQMLWVQRGEGCLVIYDFVTSFKAEKWKVNVGDAWFQVSLLPLSWSSGLQSDQVGFSLFFYCDGHGLAKKLLLIISIFWQISSTFRYALILCTKAPFSILKKISALITSGECSCGHYLESLFCVYDKSEEISFGHIRIAFPALLSATVWVV